MRGARAIGSGLGRLLASYGLACVLLLLLFVLTLLGTLEQTQIGLYAAKQRYFQSWWLLARLPGGGALPMPGALTVMGLLAVNLVAGVVWHGRWHWRNLGLLMAHTGVLMVLAGGFLTYRVAREGMMTLCPGESSQVVRNPRQWELVVTDPSDPERHVEYRVPEVVLAGATTGRPVVAEHPALPFDLRILKYAAHADVGPGREGSKRAIRPKPPRPQPEANRPAVRVRIGAQGFGAWILWGGEDGARRFEQDGHHWHIELRRKTWRLPFVVRLERFEREFHPGTQIPRAFRSRVRTGGGADAQTAVIQMNEPLRRGGYTLFQSSYRPGEDGRLCSTLAVVRNPAEPVAPVGCAIMILGLCIHYGRRLIGHLGRRGGPA